MSATLICLAICAAIALGGTICQSLRNEVTIQNIQYIKPDSGFKNFIGSSYSSTTTIAMSKAEKACKLYANKISNFIPSGLKGRTQEFIDMINAVGEYGAYEFEDATKAITTVEYSNSTNVLSIFNIIFSPQSDNKLKVILFDVSAKLQLPSSFIVQEMTVKNKFRTKTEQSLVEMESSLTSKTIVDAISMVLGPALNGAVEIPQDVRELYKSKERFESPGTANIPSSFK
jgi:hypothetical protein